MWNHIRGPPLYYKNPQTGQTVGVTMQHDMARMMSVLLYILDNHSVSTLLKNTGPQVILSYRQYHMALNFCVDKFLPITGFGSALE